MATIEKLCVYYHPGEDLSEKLDEMNLSVSEFAQKTGLPAHIIQDVIDGKESVSADMAIAFELVTHIPAHMWIDSQRDYGNYILEN